MHSHDMNFNILDEMLELTLSARQFNIHQTLFIKSKKN